MKNYSTLLFYFLVILTTIGQSYAAYMFIESPKSVSSNRAPLSLVVYLNGEGVSVSGVSGEFSFPSDLFDIDSITTNGGVISLWAVPPHVSSESSFDQKTHIVFEGIIPGGFNGVRSPYHTTVLPGAVFTVTLIPKNKGVGDFMLNNVEIHKYDNMATLISTKGDSRTIVIPDLVKEMVTKSHNQRNIDTGSLVTTINHDDLIRNNFDYLYVYDTNPARTIDHIEVAENNNYNEIPTEASLWKRVTNPYVLENQSRTDYLHIKAVYTDNTYAIRTIQPVENLSTRTDLSRILIGILIALILLFYYGKNIKYLFSNSAHKNS